MTPECQAGTGLSLMVNWNKGLNPCDRVDLPSNMAGPGMKSRSYFAFLTGGKSAQAPCMPRGICSAFFLPPVVLFCSSSPSLPCFSLSLSFLLKPPFSPCSEKSLTTASIRLHFTLKCIRVVFHMNKYSFCKIIYNGEDWNYLVTIADKANVD